MTRVVLAVSAPELSGSATLYEQAVAWLSDRGYDVVLVASETRTDDPTVTCTVPVGLHARDLGRIAKDVVLSFLRNGPRPGSMEWFDTAGQPLGGGALEWPNSAE